MSSPGSNLPFTDPWTVLGVHKGASREEVKAAFRRAALVCHPDVDPSPSASARFAEVKAAADALLKGHQQPAHSYNPAAAAARAHAGGASVRVPRNRVAALWGSLLVACGLAFGYGYGWASYVRSKTNFGTPEEVEERIRNPIGAMQRRKLLQALHQDASYHQKQQQQQQRGLAAQAPGSQPTPTASVGGS